MEHPGATLTGTIRGSNLTISPVSMQIIGHCRGMSDCLSANWLSAKWREVTFLMKFQTLFLLRLHFRIRLATSAATTTTAATTTATTTTATATTATTTTAMTTTATTATTTSASTTITTPTTIRIATTTRVSCQAFTKIAFWRVTCESSQAHFTKSQLTRSCFFKNTRMPTSLKRKSKH